MIKVPDTSTHGLIEKFASKAVQLPAIERRDFLKNGLKLAAASTLATKTTQLFANDESLPPQVPAWTRSLGSAVLTNPYGVPSQYESDVIRRTVSWLTVSPISSVSMSPLHELKGIITPNGLVFERYHAGIPNIHPDQHRLIIHGRVKRPLILTMDELMQFPSTSVIHFLECPANGGMEWRGAQMEALQFTHGMLSCCEWTGVRLSVLLDEVGIEKDAKWMLAEGADGAAMSRSIPIEKALDDSLVVFAQNGEMLRPEQGYPVRLFNPGWEGNTSIKWLRRLELGDKPWHQREETSKYTDLMEDGRARQFTFIQEANSIITSPCPERPWSRRGLHQLEGLAWSGRGKIKRVDVSMDGGVNWQTARLTGLVLSKALTRFRLEINWQGDTKLLQSRAIDETGYVQPSLAQLRKARGRNSIYHKNSIHTWKLDPDGTISNVQLG